MRRRVLRVASHNIMDGVHMNALLEQYARFSASQPIQSYSRSQAGLSVLCMQEVVPGAAEAAASSLGGGRQGRFVVASCKSSPRMAIVYDRTMMQLCELQTVPLPLLSHVPLWQRFYTSGKPEQRLALIGKFQMWPHCRRQFAELKIANFHLDAAGDNAHRTAQLRALVSALDSEELPLSPVVPALPGRRTALHGRKRRSAVVLCGDTNAFDFDENISEQALHGMLAPVRTRLGAVDAHASIPQATHFFARADEPKLGQRIAVAFGRLGVDFPRRYDIVATSPRCVEAGQLTTPGSDHDLVWAAMAF